MLKFVGFLLPVFLIVCVSVYVHSWCEEPTAFGLQWSATHDESLCDAGIGTFTENPNEAIKTFVCSGSVDHYSDADSALPEVGFYSMEVEAVYSRIMNMVIVRQAAVDNDAAFYVGGCSETVAAKIHYGDPDLAQFFHGEGEVDIWGSRKTFDSEYIDQYIYDHDEDVLDPLGMI
jgi:hypothetical protein